MEPCRECAFLRVVGPERRLPDDGLGCADDTDDRAGSPRSPSSVPLRPSRRGSAWPRRSPTCSRHRQFHAEPRFPILTVRFGVLRFGRDGLVSLGARRRLRAQDAGFRGRLRRKGRRGSPAPPVARLGGGASASRAPRARRFRDGDALLARPRAFRAVPQRARPAGRPSWRDAHSHL
jgi:hypothetical protein